MKNKSFKLLCCLLISVFLFGLGGERVLAAESKLTVSVPGNTVQEQSWYYELVGNGYENSLVKKDQNGNYVFCLDSNQKLYGGELDLANTLSGYKTGFKEKIGKIVSNAYRLGLGDGNNSHNIKIVGSDGNISEFTISEKDLYGVTQSAVWYAAHGEDPDGGYSWKYKAWVEGKNYTAIFTELMKETSEYSISFGKVSPAQDDDDNYFYSDKYILKQGNIPGGVSFKLSSDPGVEFKINDGEWEVLSSDRQLNVGDTFVSRNTKPTTGTKSYKFKIETNEFYKDYEVSLYSSPENYQNIVSVKPTKDKVSTNFYNDTTVSDTKKTLTINKKSGNEYIAGARLRLYIPGSTDSEVDTVVADIISTDSSSGITYSVDVDHRYCVKEIDAPYGYVLSDDIECVDVTSISTTEELTLNIDNQKLKVKFRKVDANGNPISGVEIKIRNYAKYVAKLDDMYICAITDNNGYLTIPCTGQTKTSDYCVLDGNENCTGEYYYEQAQEKRGQIYFIQEEFAKGYYVPAFDKNNFAQDFYLSDDLFFTEYSSNNYIYLSGELGTSSVPTINIVNDKYINISKTDTGTGKEISGAEMHLYDATVTDDALSENPLFVEVDSWISDGTPHAFVGIKPNRKYVLSETVAPKGYVKLQTDIEFMVDENGKVEVLTVQQDVKGSDENSNWLIVGNSIEAPSTGMSIINLFAIGGLMVFVGYEVIKLYKRRVNS